MTFWHNLLHPHLHSVHTTQWFLIDAGIATVIFIALLAIMHRLSPRVKRYIIISCTFLAGLFTVVEYVWPTHKMMIDGSMADGNFLSPYLGPVNDFSNYIWIWALGLGILSLAFVHARRLFGGHPGWHNSLAFFFAFFAMTVACLASWGGKHSTVPLFKTYDLLFNGLLINLDSAMFALLAFYIASAAYRAFRVRTLEAVLLMFSALIVMLGFISFGVWLTSGIPVASTWTFFRMENLSSWILNWINAPVSRGVLIGVAIGGVAVAMRLWLSLERGTFFSQE